MEYRAVSPSTGMITDIFLAEIIPSGVARFLRVATRRSYPPKISTYRTWKKNESGKRRWWKGPKRGLHSPFRSFCKVSLSPSFLCLLFRHKCFPFVFAPTRYRFAGAFHFATISRRREEVSGGILIQDRKFTAS